MIVYTLYSDTNGNPIITRGDSESLTITIPRLKGVEISEEEAIGIAGTVISIPPESVNYPNLSV